MAIPIRPQFASMSELAELIMKKKAEEESSRQFNEQNRIAQSQEGRQQELQPFHIQQMRDAHSTSMLNNLVNQKAMQRAEAAWPYIKQQYEDAHKGKVSEQGLADVKNETIRRSYQHELDLANQRQEQQNSAQQAAIPQDEPGDFLTQGQPQGSPQQFMPQQAPSPNMGQQTPPESIPQQMPQNAPIANQQAPNMPPSNASTPQQVNARGEEITITPGDPNKGWKNVEEKPSAGKIVNGYQIKTYPDGKVTATKLPVEMANNQRQTALEDKMKLEEYKAKLRGTEFEKQIGTEDAKNLSNLNKNLIVAREVQPNIDYIRSLANSPEMQSIKRNPLLFGKDITYFKKAGTKEEQRTIGEMTAVQKNMYADMAQKFKGAFRAGEQKLFEDLLPSDKDTLEVMLGKIQGMDALNRSVIQRLSMVDDLVRDQSNKTTINHAMEQADKKFPISEIKKQVKAEYENNQNEMVNVKDSVTGKITKMTRAEYNKLAEEHNG